LYRALGEKSYFDSTDFSLNILSAIKAIDWRVILFSLGLLVLFISLGMWQLRRADEKTLLLATQELKRSQIPIENLAGYDESVSQMDGLPVHLHGSYLPGVIALLDNVVVGGRVGFDVLVWFSESTTTRLYLVNRGFVPMGRTRADIPEIPALMANVHELNGHIYARHYDEDSFLPLATFAKPESDANPVNIKITQQANPLFLSINQLVAESGDHMVYPYLVRLTLDDPNGLPRNWITTNITPAKHTGYAIQWFLMAIAVAILFGRLVLKQEISDSNTGIDTGAEE